MNESMNEKGKREFENGAQRRPKVIKFHTERASWSMDLRFPLGETNSKTHLL